ncbi:MAG: amidohydrolase [Desulfovibrio sp.]|nr:amidohydrolase [Desulfovibrio sp.]
MNHCDIIVHARHILTQDNERKHIEEASVAIRDGLIVAVDSRKTIARFWQAPLERDLGNSLILPGLINAHTHAAMTFLRGYADDLPLVQWLTEKIFPIEASLTKEIVETASLLGFAEMLRTGTTSCLDMYIFEPSVFKAAEKAGIGLTAGEVVFTFPSAACPSYKEALSVTHDLARTYADSRRLQVVISPHAVYTSTPDILKACLEASDKLHIPIHMHLAESEAETKQCLSQHGLRPIPYCKKLGFMERALSLAHVVDVNNEELTLLNNASDAVVIHNPGSNMKLASGIAPIPAMLSQGMTVALGTDGPASNNQLNMFLEMNRAALLHKVASKASETLPAQKVLDMATLGGARALHRDDIGSLAVGKRADLTALDLTQPNLIPLYDPVSQLVYAAQGSEVILTMVEGEILYDHGLFTRFSYTDLCHEMESIRSYVQKKFS